ncbi:hypothetical protein Pelo_435 [Pelomyxa schiedti]|nr:hypothetical protein Pelo_435 [Pelomyxa schiedti]
MSMSCVTQATTSTSTTASHRDDCATSPRLPFVDRNIEIELLVRVARENELAYRKGEGEEKPIVLFTAQLFGSGKTYFAKNAIPYLRQDFESRGPITQNLLNNPAVDPKDSRCDLKLLRSLVFTEKDVDQFSQARTILMDMAKLDAIPGASFEDSLACALASKAKEGVNAQEVFNDKSCSTLVHLNKILTDNYEGYWVICLDEIGALESAHVQAKFHIPPENCYDSLFYFISQVLFWSKFKVTFFICGKSWKLVQIALQKSLTSPLRLRYLGLGALHENYIETILRATPISEFLPEEDFRPIAKVVFKLSGGIPRIIQRMYTHLLAHAKVHATCLLDAEEVEALLAPSTEFGSNITSDTTIVTEASCGRASIEELDMHETTLLHLAVLDAVIPSEEVADILSVFPCYITPDGSGFKPVFSAYWIARTKEKSSPLSVPLWNLLSLLQSAPPVLDQGRIFELISTEVIAARLLLDQRHNLGCALPCLNGTVLGSVHIEAAVADSPHLFPLAVCPSINSQTTIGSPTENSFNPKDWDLFLNKLQEQYLNHVLLPSSPQSHSSDLLIPLSVNPTDVLVFGDPTSKITHILEFAFKNIQGSTAAKTKPTSWPDIREEVQKGLYTPRNGKNTALVHFTLVFASTQLAPTIENIMKHQNCSAIVLQSGYTERRWILSKDELSLSEAPSTQSNYVIGIPTHCDLVILGQVATKELFGTEVLAMLTQHFKGPRVQSYFKSIVRVQPALHAICSRKRPPPTSHYDSGPTAKLARYTAAMGPEKGRIVKLAEQLPATEGIHMVRYTALIEATPELQYLAEHVPLTAEGAQELLKEATKKEKATLNQIERVKTLLVGYSKSRSENLDDVLGFLEYCPLELQIAEVLSRVTRGDAAVKVVRKLMAQYDG